MSGFPGSGFGFGTQPPAAPFGGSTPQGTPFGSSPPPAGAPTTFASPASFAPPASSGTMFGAPPPASGFGGFGGAPAAPATGSFFGQLAQAQPFSSPPSAGNAFGVPFASQQQQQQQQQQPNIPNPFGAPTTGTPATAVSFGISSNIVTVMNTGSSPAAIAPPSSNQPFGGTNQGPSSFPSAAPFGSAPSSSSNPFGGVSSTTFGGGMMFAPPVSASHDRKQSSSSVEMGGSESPTPTTAFGNPFQTTNNHNNTMDAGGTGSLSPIPEDSMGDSSGGPPLFSAPRENKGSAEGVSEEDKLARLKAKIEAKRKKLLDRQKRKQQGETGTSTNSTPDRSNQESSQAKEGRHRRSRSRSVSPLPTNAASDAGDNNQQQSRAERNAARFAGSTNAATQAHMPSELKNRSDIPKPSTTSAVGEESNREDLANAKSLVGTCQYMCPDEELLRRERENDIQLLEIPDRGGIHPEGWTLRNTVVKRFRRSAADYKLDVPEWVRPPDVLEEVCSYLEEWVMERDRQGPDRRFPNNGTPNSMDVYQFIWDRTRMIRKDFTLQNYVGTGGKCDARAVRCHERIARWHAMCEHQLSHLNEFAVMQSQQNIQELGQAMKTLNQFYDDSLGRAVIEVPDDQGRETRTNMQGFTHGCKSDCCEGGNPIDYDGSPLNNSPNASKNRLIGKDQVNSPTRGTAEPEMRGLYILLTMNNDGGMEVMRYSASLYRERPEIYNSRPVQLALDIFKAKKDYNYVRFFEILRNPSTPYLFACIMFKHVELMRKLAFRIMAKTYGARRKENGEPIYDAYPLKKLAEVLCFEDMDEAREACKHYNITVKEMKVRSSSSPGQVGSAEIIYWRHSDFKEPRDPSKGTIIPLRPRKMLRSIESKLNGATRLGVCRGEVSGEGATLSRMPTATLAAAVPVAFQSTSPHFDISAAKDQTDAASQERLFALQQEDEAKKKEEKERAQREERERVKAEKLRLKLEAKKKLEEQKRQMEALARQRAAQNLEEERKRKEEERQRKENEERERAERAAQEAKRIQEEAARRKIEEEARKKAEAEEREKQRLEALRKEEERKQQEIRAEQERRRQEEAERVRQELERKRLEALKLQEEERKRAQKAAQELARKVNQARKLLLVRRWRLQLPRHFKSDIGTKESLQRIDPTFSLSSPLTGTIGRHLESARTKEHSKKEPEVVDTRKILNRILSKDILPLDVASMMLKSICEDEELMEHIKTSRFSGSGSAVTKTTFLIKVAIILPEPDPDGLEEASMYESIHTWLNRRLEYDTTDTVQQTDSSGARTVEVRVLFVKADSWGGPVSCDAALFVIPPSFCSGDWKNSRKVEAISSAFDCVDQETPRVAYILAERFDSEYFQSTNQFLVACLPNTTEEFPVVFPSSVSERSLDGSLMSCLKALTEVYTREFPPIVEQVSVTKLAARCISNTLWQHSGFDSLESARATLTALDHELSHVGQSIEESWSGWPVDDFAGEDGLVMNYFGEGMHLPTSWTSPVFRDTAKSKIMDLHNTLQNSAPVAIAQLIRNAPLEIQQECEEMVEKRHYRKCIQRALQFIADEDIFYLPKGSVDSIAVKTIQNVGAGSERVKLLDSTLMIGEDENDGELTEELEGDAAIEMAASGYSAVESKDADLFKREDMFEESRAISPVPPGNKTPSLKSPPMARDTSPPPGVSSTNKRNWKGMSNSDDGIEAMESPFTPPTNRYDGLFPFASMLESSAKRPRRSPDVMRSRHVMESAAFTKKLQALLNGEATIDMEVGNTTLARLIRDTPLLDPKEHRGGY